MCLARLMRQMGPSVERHPCGIAIAIAEVFLDYDGHPMY